MSCNHCARLDLQRVGGANHSYLARNVLNATGYMTFAAGAAKVACIKSGTEIQEGAYLWSVLLGAVIATTIQFQDLYDRYAVDELCPW